MMTTFYYDPDTGKIVLTNPLRNEVLATTWIEKGLTEDQVLQKLVDALSSCSHIYDIVDDRHGLAQGRCIKCGARN